MITASDEPAQVESGERSYETLIFDLDRTLVEHDQSFADVFEAACIAGGIEPFCGPEALDLATRLVGRQSTGVDAETFDRRVFETAAAAAGVAIDSTEFANAYDDALDNGAVSLRPGADTALAAAEDYDSALVTNGPERTHATKLEAVGIEDRFDAVVFGSDVARVKPAVDPLERALKRLDSKPSRTLKVGDSLAKDVTSANDLGIDSAWVPYGNRTRASSDPEPTYVLSSLADLPSVLSK
ncbi:HAD family hydrolase [Halomicrococcus sp. SG-WS-1]|uniref:HAD family hydrolase n=1 Tax=Halomicrococcus sp. SG-WS-1 TaxID=3439057 RepID=UPI003F7941E2